MSVVKSNFLLTLLFLEQQIATKLINENSSETI